MADSHTNDSPDERSCRAGQTIWGDLRFGEAAGLRAEPVGVVAPNEEFVLVDTADAAPRQLSGDNLLKRPNVLPGFSVRVREFFE